jgi:uncharacterized lipoprotein YmbA
MSDILQRQFGFGWSKPCLAMGFAAISAALVACSSTPMPNYYTLTPTVAPLAGSNIKVIEVLPVGLPDRLDRSQIVVQDVSGKSNVSDVERWSSSLSNELRDGLSSGVQQQLGAVDRYKSGIASGDVAYRIAVDFSRFDIVQPDPKLATRPDALEVNVVVAWIIKRLDTRPAAVNANKNALANDRQLSCRMTFVSPINTPAKPQTLDMVASSRQALQRVVNAVSLSVVGLDSGINNPNADVTCS